MPEGDTIFRTARTLTRALVGQTLTGFETVLPKLARVDTDSPLVGRTIDEISANGKWLTMRFSGGLTLLTHMLMTGSWHIYRPGERWHARRSDMRIVLRTAPFVAVAFNVPVAEFHTDDSLRRHPSLRRLGLDVLAPEFDAAEAAARLRSQPALQIGDALLDQSLLAGVGNVFKSEICFAARVHPMRPVATLTDAEMNVIVHNSRKFLLANVADGSGTQIITYTGPRRTTGRANPAESLWVYGRRHEACRVCGTPIVMQKQGPGARVSFWCPRCQPAELVDRTSQL